MLLIKNNSSTLKHHVGFSHDGFSDPAMTFTGTTELTTLKLIFSKIKLVLLADNLTENQVLCEYNNPKIPVGADLTGASGQVMVKIPRFYYKETIEQDGRLSGVEISEYQKEGFICHPKFVKPDNSLRTHIYIGAYEASNSGSNILQSVSGVAPLTSVSLATFRSRAFARGEGWYPYDFWTQHLIQMLFYAYYGNFNSQLVLPGYTEATSNELAKRTTGRSNMLSTINGSIDADLAGFDSDLAAYGVTAGEKIANRFLFVENIFGHIWKFLDGVVFDGRVAGDNRAYVTNNPALFSSVDAEILANYEAFAATLPAATNENYIQYLQAGFLPKSHGGSSSTYVTDYFWLYLDDATRDYLRVVLAGGSLNDGGLAGVAARLSNNGLSSAYWAIGSRLCAAPL